LAHLMAAAGRSDLDHGVVEINPQQLRAAYDAGATLTELARHYRISNQIIRALIVAAGGTIRQPFGGKRRQVIRIVGARDHRDIMEAAAALAGAAEVERDTDWDDVQW
jgi:hypothetical protein